MKPNSKALSIYLFLCVCATGGYLIVFYASFILAVINGGSVLITVNDYNEMYIELALLITTAPGIILAWKHLIKHWFV